VDEEEAVAAFEEGDVEDGGVEVDELEEVP